MLPASLKPLFETPEPAALGPERRRGTMTEDKLRRAAGVAGLSESRRQAVLALLLLWHDLLDASHVISQGVDSADGSFVHALMHRREPDYGNACYWWRRVGDHPVLPGIGARAAAYLQSVNRRDLARTLVREGGWDPVAFTEMCQRVAGRPARHPEVELLRELQRIEFETLLGYLVAPEPGGSGPGESARGSRT